jgi:hypothetical protein
MDKKIENVAEMSKHHTIAASRCDNAAKHHTEAAKQLAAGNPEKAADHAVKADALVGEAIQHTAKANKHHPQMAKKSCC